MPGQMVQLAVNGRSTSAYLTLPPAGRGPGVVVIQEWWGLVDHIKKVCDRVASEGFVALAPDLYHGQTTKSPDEAGKLMMALRIAEAEQDLRASIKHLTKIPEVTSTKIGVVGFCMGGALALYAATKSPEVGACVVFYGGHPSVKPDLPNLQAPMLGLYAGRDGFVTPASVRALDQQLTALGKPHEIHIYADADHAFFNDERPAYDPQAAADGWARTIEFFRTHLSQAA